MIRLLSVILVSFVFFSCGKKETTEIPNANNDKKDTVKKTESEVVKKTTESPVKDSAIIKTTSLKWEFKTLGRGKFDEPNTQVYVVVNGKKHEVQKIEFSFSEVVKESYLDHHIPGDALLACRGWWAGAGIDYWLTRSGNELQLFSREIGETTTEDGEPSDYEGKPVKIKTISVEQ